MATVNLNEILRRRKNPNSNIEYRFQDFSTLTMENLEGNYINSKKVKKDLKASYDIHAIQNSVVNILTTKKRQKILEPEFGLRIEDYLFEPVSTTVASVITKEITDAIINYEPRIKIVQLNVIPYYDEQVYQINLIYSIPSLKTSVTLKGNIREGTITVR